MNLLIPIIGSISSGKSTFLKGLLGIDELEEGINTTTKFVCLIKNNSQNSFYKVNLENKNDKIILTKIGEEIKDLNEIKIKIEQLNKQFLDSNPSKQELFYMFETPIKYINNSQILDNCIFMDIPGLNEVNTNYIDDIFSIITLKNILFEIFIFDATSFQSDNILNIILELDKKKCLQKEGNLYILNKIDNITKDGEDSIIEKFKYYFYENFDKNSNKNPFINIYRNYFVPVNSILFRAETKFENDFCSWLIIELFYYKQICTKEISSFFEYLGNRLNNILSEKEIKESYIEKEYNNIKEDEINKISESIDKLNIILTKTLKSDNFIFGIKMDKPKIKKVMIKLYIIHKKKLISNYIICQFYDEIQTIIKNIKIKKEDNLSSPPPALNEIKKEISKQFMPLMEYCIFGKMKDFLQNRFGNHFEELNSNLNSLEEYILYKKIRISFIGPISVGKSTVLNCIIGEKILPTKIEECTYRGVIIKHDPYLDDFYLYKAKTQIINGGFGLREYTIFTEDKEPYCKGVKNIKSYLTTKNNDKFIDDDSEAFIIIKGKLKIFEIIQLEQNLIDKIEFIDLPGFDREENEFNKKKYYHKILKFSNSCIYINTASKIRAAESFNRMYEQYNDDKNNIFILLKPKFIDTCLFLINKSDELPLEKDREQARKDLIDKVCQMEPLVKDDKKRINISFFSGECFFNYLKNIERYVTNMMNNPLLTLEDLYNKWSSTKSFSLNFKKYIVEIVSAKIEDDFGDLDEKPVPEQFNKKLKEAFAQFYSIKNRNMPPSDENQIIKTLYNIHELFAKKDFSKTKYSHKFFEDLKRMIINSDILQKENFHKNFEAFFQNTDELFAREIKKEIETEKKKGEENYTIFIHELIPETEKYLIEKENIIKNILDSAKSECIKEVNLELDNRNERLSNCNYNLNAAFFPLEEKIEKILKKMEKDQEEIMNTLIEGIKKKANEIINSYYISQNIKDYGVYVPYDSFLKILEDLILNFFMSAWSAGTGLAVGTTLGAYLGLTCSLAVGAGTFIGCGILGIVVIPAFLFFGDTMIDNITFHFKKKQQYKEILNQFKTNLQNKFDDIIYSFTDHYKTFKDTLIKELKLKTEIYLKKINSDESEWNQIREEYKKIKKETQNLINEFFNSDDYLFEIFNKY